MRLSSSLNHILLAGLLLILTGCGAGREAELPVPPPVVDDATIVSHLAGTVWVAEYIHGVPVMDMSHTSMVLTTKGKVFGLGGCNNYSGKYALEGGVVTFPPLATTMKMCAPALSDQEVRFFQSLSVPQTVSFENGMLYLTPKEGKPSVFAPHSTE